MTVARANISVDKKVFDNFAAQAMLEGKTLFALTNEWLDAGANAILKQFDTIVLPSDFVDEMVMKLYAYDKDGLLKSFADLGKQLVGVLKIVAGSIDELSELAKDFTLFTPIKRFEVKKKDDRTSEMVIVGAGKKIESTECCYEFLKAVLNGYGYDVSSHEIYASTIRVTATRRSPA
jgi:hypothetical protein